MNRMIEKLLFRIAVLTFLVLLFLDWTFDMSRRHTQVFSDVALLATVLLWEALHRMSDWNTQHDDTKERKDVFGGRGRVLRNGAYGTLVVLISLDLLFGVSEAHPNLRIGLVVLTIVTILLFHWSERKTRTSCDDE